MTTRHDGAVGDARKRNAETSHSEEQATTSYVGHRDQWRAAAEAWKANRAMSRILLGSHDAADVILALLDHLEGPCGSCHPCDHWAAETWRRAGGELPHKYVVDELREFRDNVLALANEWANQTRDFDEDTEQQIEDGNTLIALAQESDR